MSIEYRGKVRAHDVEASWEAAATQTRSKSAVVQAVILWLLERHGAMTDERLVELYREMAAEFDTVPRVTPQSVRTNRHALHVQASVIMTGERRRTRLGNTATVWSLAPSVGSAA